MATQPTDDTEQVPEPRRSPAAEAILRRAPVYPGHDAMVIDDLTEEEGRLFLEAVKS